MESCRQGAKRREAVGRPKRSTLARRPRRYQVLLQENRYVPNPTPARRGYPAMDRQEEGIEDLQKLLDTTATRGTARSSGRPRSSACKPRSANWRWRWMS